MANRLRNEAEVKRFMLPRIKTALDYVMEQIAKDNRQLIERYVYSAYDPSIYERTGEFKEAWDYETQTKSSSVESTFEYKPDMMAVDNAMWQHGSQITTQDWWLDSREYLAELIYEGNSSMLWGGGDWTKKRDAWQKLIDDVGDVKFYKWFETGLRKAGLQGTRTS